MAAECPLGWLAGAMPPGAGSGAGEGAEEGAGTGERAGARVPGMTTVDQADVFCRAFSGNLGWPNTVEEMGTINALALAFGVRTYWIGLEKRGGVWLWSNGSRPTFSNWRGREPDGCCGGNVSCAIVGYANFPGARWDDTSCNRVPPGINGYFCRRN